MQAQFSNLQVELLKIYAQSISEAQLQQVKKLLGEFFANTATEAMDKYIAENQIDTETLQEWTNEHNRSEAGS